MVSSSVNSLTIVLSTSPFCCMVSLSPSSEAVVWINKSPHPFSLFTVGYKGIRFFSVQNKSACHAMLRTRNRQDRNTRAMVQEGAVFVDRGRVLTKMTATWLRSLRLQPRGLQNRSWEQIDPKELGDTFPKFLRQKDSSRYLNVASIDSCFFKFSTKFELDVGILESWVSVDFPFVAFILDFLAWFDRVTNLAQHPRNSWMWKNRSVKSRHILHLYQTDSFQEKWVRNAHPRFACIHQSSQFFPVAIFPRDRPYPPLCHNCRILCEKQVDGSGKPCETTKSSQREHTTHKSLDNVRPPSMSEFVTTTGKEPRSFFFFFFFFCRWTEFLDVITHFSTISSGPTCHTFIPFWQRQHQKTSSEVFWFWWVWRP